VVGVTAWDSSQWLASLLGIPPSGWRHCLGFLPVVGVTAWDFYECGVTALVLCTIQFILLGEIQTQPAASS